MLSFGQTATLSLNGPVSVKAGQDATILVTTTGGPAAEQFTINVPVDVASVAVNAAAPGKTAYCGAFAAQKITCLLLSLNSAAAIPDGAVATVTATFKGALTATNEVFSVTNPVAGSVTGTALAVAVPANLVIAADKRLNACDVDGDGQITGADTQVVVDVARGIASAPTGSRTDLNGDGNTDVLDAILSVLAGLKQIPCP